MAYLSGDFYAPSLRYTTTIKVILPDESNDVDALWQGEPRVLYLLHGLSANSGEWPRFSKIEYYAKKYNFVVIMPEVQRGFYCDSKSGPAHFTYITQDLPRIMGQWLRINQSAENTFIAGESMGGYGAFKAALRCPGQYSAAASLSGVLDFKRLVADVIQGNWADMSPAELRALLGPQAEVPPEDDPLALAATAAKLTTRPRMLQICGTEDFLYPHNLTYKAAAKAAGLTQSYMEWPGEHSWPFWDVAIQRAFQFFCGMDTKTSEIF